MMADQMKPVPKTAVYTFDGTLEGYFSLIFVAFQDKIEPIEILDRSKEVQTRLDSMIDVETNDSHAKRVRDGLIRRSDRKNLRLFHVAFLSQQKETYMLLWRYLKKLFSDETGSYHRNLLDEDVYDLVQCARKVRKEVHRFNGFIRFQKSIDGMFFAPIDPDHDIVKLLAPHFKSRFADQEWVIYDVKRKYGIWYDKVKVQGVVFDKPAFDLSSCYIREHVRDHDEDYYRTLWQHYYDAINIIERQNHKQMKAFMPKRYWKYLPEKQHREK